MNGITWIGSPNHYNGRDGYHVNHITLHIMVGRLTGTDVIFQRAGYASAHYGIGGNGEIHQYVNETDGSWSDANHASNNSTISIEHEGGMPGIPCTQACMDASAALCADIARRYGWDHLWHDGLNGNIWLHREVPGTDHAGCPDLAPNGLDVNYVINKANQLLTQGEDMPVKTDPIEWYGQNVTVEYALQDLTHRVDALAARLGPISEKYPFDYLPAILNNTESTYLAVNGLKPGDSEGLTDEQVDKLADSLKTSLGQQVAAELAKRLND
nr:MAG TPA: N-acetylmuramoyl-L-alanine amidase [Caudoviricetes sp.]DAP17371.1 MAG TPA: N-acetylmuramoyl-L-alanine amidase [Caudoviricetes sp.]